MSEDTTNNHIGLIQLLKLTIQKTEESEQVKSLIEPLSFKPINTGYDLFDISEYLMVASLKLKSWLLLFIILHFIL